MFARILRNNFKNANKLSFMFKRLQATTENAAELANFPGASAPYTHEPALIKPESHAPIPVYRVIDQEGAIVEGAAQLPEIDAATASKMFRSMVRLQALDKILYESHRQGRITFYMTNTGEEALQVGSAAALETQDLIFAQYRESGVLVYRGFTIAEFIDQCYGNVGDKARGRQMPVHYGSKALNFVTISSPLATQMPQAAGAAYAFKLRPQNDACVICYFGEGTASEGDAHAAFNFAATLECPVVFFCRNNGFAISTPTSEQYHGDGIASHGPGYGMATIRVDGTDILAVYNATRIAREYALRENKPVLVEAMAYRIGHHSTSDDSTAYRNEVEIELWQRTANPLTKFKNYMARQGWFDEAAEEAYAAEVRKDILKQLKVSEKKLKPSWREMFEDVYSELPDNLKEQRAELEAHIKAHKHCYPLQEHVK